MDHWTLHWLFMEWPGNCLSITIPDACTMYIYMYINSQYWTKCWQNVSCFVKNLCSFFVKLLLQWNDLVKEGHAFQISLWKTRFQNVPFQKTSVEYVKVWKKPVFFCSTFSRCSYYENNHLLIPPLLPPLLKYQEHGHSSNPKHDLLICWMLKCTIPCSWKNFV